MSRAQGGLGGPWGGGEALKLEKFAYPGIEENKNAGKITNSMQKRFKK